MKYMGSKRSMLLNGLGELLTEEAKDAKRFIDLFSGSGAVATFVAKRLPIEVHAYDLQKYSVDLANAVLKRTTPISTEETWVRWHSRARLIFQRYSHPKPARITRISVEVIREWCAIQKDMPITCAYGGHYFSAAQALWIDALRKTLPRSKDAKNVCLAALIDAASHCVAAPGHTAQPFQPTKTAKRFLIESWSRDVLFHTKQRLQTLGKDYSKVIGNAQVRDANLAAQKVRKGDLVFIDPPYSGVHYSRFYHVLETIARGRCGKVEGSGRYPKPSLRPKSQYSLKQGAAKAFDELLTCLAKQQATAIVTFPNHACSNGLSGSHVRAIASKHFGVVETMVESRFSTMGGTGRKSKNKQAARAARHHAKELMLLLKN